jgi:hypothetical protein
MREMPLPRELVVLLMPFAQIRTGDSPGSGTSH